MSNELKYTLIIILALLLVVFLFGNSKVSENMAVVSSKPRLQINSYSDSPISQQNKNMHEPNKHPASKCVSYRPHYDSNYSNCSYGCLNGYCNPHDVDKGSFQLYDHLDKQNRAMGVNHTHNITNCSTNFDMIPYQYMDNDRNMMLPFAYYDGHKLSSKNPVANMANPNLGNTCINVDRILESNNFDRVCVESDRSDAKNNAYSDEIHENLGMDNDRSNLTNNIKPKKCTYSHIDPKTSVLPLAYDCSYTKVASVDGLNNIANYVDATQADRLSDIHGPNTKNLAFVKANKMHLDLL